MFPNLATRRTWTQLSFAAAIAVTAPVALAGYTVIDDDLLPTATTELARPSHYSVPFPSRTSGLTNVARNMLESVAPFMQGASIRVVGRPDALVYARGKFGDLASERANNIRNYLLRQGISADSIAIEIDKSPNPQQNGSTYPVEIYVTRSQDSRLQRHADIYSSEAALRFQPNIKANVPANPQREQLLQFINQAVQSGQMAPSVAMQLLRALVDSERAVPAPAQWQSPESQIQVVATTQHALPLIVAAPTFATNQNWVLDKSMNLRDNIDAWSKQAGWNSVVWDASNFYQVTATTNLSGNFPGVLRQIADSTGLNICAKNHEKYVRVTDSSTPCK